ncbi:hypothetical protein [Acidithiobacillus marinus]|uniref:hypothetical protein n=1 Tax=Acidithiobacillus marinus TaxID=187490 RepID=UPI001553C705|nr:hypothetical protein [Acidithiobacillus marinus]
MSTAQLYNAQSRMEEWLRRQLNRYLFPTAELQQQLIFGSCQQGNGQPQLAPD